MPDELDVDLKALFEEESRRLPGEPFLGDMLRLLEKRRFRRIMLRRLAYVLVLACAAGLSPFLIDASTMLSLGVNELFSAVNRLVNTSAGMSIALVVLLLILFRRRHASRLI